MYMDRYLVVTLKSTTLVYLATHLINQLSENKYFALYKYV